MQSQLTWDSIIKAEETQPYFQDIVAFIKQERAAGKTIYPSDEEIFNAFKYTPFSNVKVVILGQDPYHGENQAHGLSFSVRPDVKIPPSLRNIYKELANDIPNFDIPKHGHLVNWAKQGVLLLNTVLTVEAKQAHSHAKIGWETFTDKIIETINQHQKNVVFLLWGSHAQKKGAFINTERHAVLKSVHPSPLSAHRGFLGCQHFSLTNEYLKSKGKQPIDWNDLKI